MVVEFIHKEEEVSRKNAENKTYHVNADEEGEEADDIAGGENNSGIRLEEPQRAIIVHESTPPQRQWSDRGHGPIMEWPWSGDGISSRLWS